MQPNPSTSSLAASAGNERARRSKICAICKVDTGNFNMNYGANSCLSCRAFFRRAIQKARSPTFECKKEGKCEVMGKTELCPTKQFG
jgi:hypothetical protein